MYYRRNGALYRVVIGVGKFENRSRLACSKVALFHIYYLNENAAEDVKTHIAKMQKKGFAVKVALHGGVTENEKSMEMAGDLRQLFVGLKVKVEFDQTCEKRGGKSTSLGGVVRYFYPGHPDNYAVQFVTQVKQNLPFTGQ